MVKLKYFRKIKIIDKIKSTFEASLVWFIVVVFKIIGIAPLSLEIKIFQRFLSVNANRSVKGLIYNFILSFYILIVVFFYIYDDILKNEHKLDYVVQVFIEVFEIITMTVVEVTFCFKQRQMLKIIKRIISLEKESIEIHCDTNRLKEYRYKNVLLAALQVVGSIMLAIIKAIDHEGSVFKYIALTIPKFVIGLTLIQFSIIMGFINRRFRLINEEFVSLSVKSSLNQYPGAFNNRRKFGSYELVAVKTKIVTLKKAYRSFYEITKSVNDLYSWLLVFGIINFATQISYNLYSLTMITIQRQLSIKVCCLFVLWSITYFSPILTLTGYISRISSETRKDTDGGSGGDEEPGSCSSRPSISETSWADAQKPSVPNEFTSSLTSIRQEFPFGDDTDNKIIPREKQETLKQPRHDKCPLRADCPVQAIEVTSCEPTDTKMEPLMISAASSSSSVSGQTRLPTSLLFELPDSRRGSTTPSDQMPAISKAQMKEFEEAFNLFDKDRDGSITKEELGRVMRGLGQFARTEELQTMLAEIDTDGDGNVSLVEFVKIVSDIGAAQQTDLTQEQQEEQELRDAFRVFDKHNRGYITASDLRAVLQCLGEDLSEEEIEDMIKEVDEDGDGRIDFCEFARSLVNPLSDEEEDEPEDEEQPPSPLPAALSSSLPAPLSPPLPPGDSMVDQK